MPNREVVMQVSITFTDKEWEELVNLYQMLDSLMEDQYPEVTDAGLTALTDSLQRTLDCLFIDK